MGEIKKARNFRNYKVWQDAVRYASRVYNVTSEMPWFEKKGLCDQLQRAVVSISSNIAEGSARPSDVEFAHFLDMALGSSYEVETQLLIAKNVGYIRQKDGNGNDNDNDNGNDNGNLNGNGDVSYEELLEELQEIERQINGLIASLRKNKI